MSRAPIPPSVAYLQELGKRMNSGVSTFLARSDRASISSNYDIVEVRHIEPGFSNTVMARF